MASPSVERPGEQSRRASARGGWVQPGLGLLIASPAYLLLRAWHQLSPATAPPALWLVAAAVLVGYLTFTLAAGVALHPAQPPAWWRPAVALVVAAAAAGVALSAGGRLQTFVPTVLILGLTARAAETIGRHLAPAVHLRGEYEPEAGEWALAAPETRRIVLETWVVCALAAAADGAARSVTVAAAAAAAGGLLLVAGSKLSGLQRLSASEGFVWDAADLAVAWRWAAGAAALAVGLGIAVPGLPALLPRGVPWLIRFLLDHARRRSPAAPAAPPTMPTAPTIAPGRGAPQAPPLPAGFRVGPDVRHAGLLAYALVELLRLLPVLIATGCLCIAGILFAVYLRTYGGDVRPVFARLWRGILDALTFWRWLRLPWSTDAARLTSAGGEAGAAAARPKAEEEGGWGMADPRRTVREGYRRFLRRAAREGRPIPTGETPARYGRAIADALPNAADDAQRLTAAYEVARYSRHPIGADAVHPVRRAVDKLISALARMRR